MRDGLLPHTIARHYRAGRMAGAFQASTLCVDISGFTQLTETLMHQRKDGAEVLSAVLNRVFGALITAVYAHHGFVTSFAGDAFTAVFPSTHGRALQRATHSAAAIAHFFAANGQIDTPYGTFDLICRVGLGHGQVRWNILGPPDHRTYFFHGPALAACVQAETAAQPGTLCAPARLAHRLTVAAHTPTADPAFHSLTFPPARRLPQSRLLATIPAATLHAFGLSPVLDQAAIGEFRDIAPVFVAVENQPTDPAGAHPAVSGVHTFAGHLIALAQKYGAYFNKLDFGDKGTVMLVLFGAPVAHEDDLLRAADFLLALQQLPHAPRWRAGLTFGTAYTGLIGGTERSEYTAIGDVVNLAARLMAGAPWQTIWVAPNVAGPLDARGYRFEAVGTLHFKGRRDALAVSSLQEKRIQAEAAFYTGAQIGRAADLAALYAHVAPLAQHASAGFAAVYGEPGIGKSRLLHELRIKTIQQFSVQWWTCPAEPILRQSLAPFRHALNTYFRQSPLATEADNQTQFNTRLDEVLATLPPASEQRATLTRTRPFLAALLGLRSEGTLYNEVDPRLRFTNTLDALQALIAAEAHRCPLILYVEDAHWLDDDTLAFLRHLLTRPTPYPLAILLTSRPLEHGDGRVALTPGLAVPTLILDLHHLAPDGVQALATQILQPPALPVSPALAHLLSEKTNGNPFFVEQLVLDMRERGLILETPAHWELAQAADDAVPPSITLVLVARLDRLSAQLKTLVQTAAVLGQEFEVRVLIEMLKPDPLLSLKVKELEHQAIWSTLNEVRYLFKHALLRDVAYGMQLKAQLRALHTLAAHAIEQIYAGNLNAHIFDLAYHYRQAEDSAHERYYAQRAGEQAAARFANNEALAYLDRALALTPEGEHAERYALLRTRERVHELQADRAAQADDLTLLSALAGELHDPQAAVEVVLRRALYANVTGNFASALAAAEQGVTLAEAAHLPVYSAEGHLEWGRALMRQAHHDEARTHLQAAQTLAGQTGHAGLQADALRTLGNVALNSGEFAQAHAHYQASLVLYRQVSDRRGMSGTVNNLGIVALSLGDYPAARRYYAEAIALFRAVGDLRGESLALGNLGEVAMLQGDLEQGFIYITRYLEISREIHNRHGESIAHNGLGDLALLRGDYPTAHAHLSEAVALARAIGDRAFESDALAGLCLLYHQLGANVRAQTHGQQALDLARAAQTPREIALALTYLGHALAGQGTFDAADTAYQEAVTLHHELNQHSQACEALAGRARIALARDDLPSARAHVESMLAELAAHPFEGAADPARAWLTGYHVLRAAGDARAAQCLSAAYTWIQTQAAQITDPTQRTTFLETIPAHRAVVSIWQNAYNEGAPA